MAFEDTLFARYPDQVRETLKYRFLNAIPHNDTLGITFVDAEPGSATLRLPYRDALVGNPDNGVIHGGVITSLIDSVSGLAVFCSLPDFETIATLDLRIDYMKPARPGRDLFARADCYKRTRQIAFVRALAYQDSPENPVASSVSSFMRGASRHTTIFRKDKAS
ncbi:MAG TPA: PaaI family thioesterase [Gammaproteobacteria bacterium]|nr:PaaI family thioesterase [Gammaproteobacteria bacterium]